jgi:hypothetical protein
MKYQIEITREIIQKTFKEALSRPIEQRGNLFYEIRESFKHQIEVLLHGHKIDNAYPVKLGKTYYLKKGKTFRFSCIPKRKKYHKELDIEFCAGYGHEEYSLYALNYTAPSLCELPSLFPFTKEEIFPIGNILVFVKNGEYEIEVIANHGINITGYSFDISSRKLKSYLCLFGVYFEPSIVNQIVYEYGKDCKHDTEDLDEIKISMKYYPVIYICRKCGQLLTCSCFDGYFDQDDLLGGIFLGDTDIHLRDKLKDIKVRDNICHLCTGRIPKLEYGHQMYYSSFMQRYLPYYHLFMRKEYGHSIFNNLELSRPVENRLRETLGFPKVGEKWLSETMLYKIIATLFPNNQVVHHYRGNELEGLELDIWIPKLKLGIEYQGEQHYKAIKHWGGEQGLKDRQKNDRKKRRLCEQLEYTLVEFRYGESLTEDSVRRRLKKFIS